MSEETIDSKLSELGLEIRSSPTIGSKEVNSLFNRCLDCQKRRCSLNEELSDAIGEGYPYWAEEFVVIKHDLYFEDSVVCMNYKPVQTYLKGFESGLNLVKKLLDEYS